MTICVYNLSMAFKVWIIYYLYLLVPWQRDTTIFELGLDFAEIFVFVRKRLHGCHPHSWVKNTNYICLIIWGPNVFPSKILWHTPFNRDKQYSTASTVHIPPHLENVPFYLQKVQQKCTKSLIFFWWFSLFIFTSIRHSVSNL